MSPDKRVVFRTNPAYIATQLPTLNPPPITRRNPTNDKVTFDISPTSDGGITISGSAADTARVLQHYVAGLGPGRRGTVTAVPTAPKAKRDAIVTIDLTTCLWCEKRFDATKTIFYSCEVHCSDVCQSCLSLNDPQSICRLKCPRTQRRCYWELG